MWGVRGSSPEFFSVLRWLNPLKFNSKHFGNPRDTGWTKEFIMANYLKQVWPDSSICILLCIFTGWEKGESDHKDSLYRGTWKWGYESVFVPFSPNSCGHLWSELVRATEKLRDRPCLSQLTINQLHVWMMRGPGVWRSFDTAPNAVHEQ